MTLTMRFSKRRWPIKHSSMNKKLILSILICISAFILPAAKAQEAPVPEPLGEEARNEFVDSVTASYFPWEELSMSGKLSSPMLPLTASVKLYMKRDSLIVMSISAPLIGEAARIEIDNGYALAVNKLHNTYTTAETAALEAFCPGGLSALQNLLLGRMSVLGAGQLSPALAPMVDIYDAGQGLWMVLPMQDIENSPFVYFYTVDGVSLLLRRFAVLAQSGEGELDFNYTYDSRSTTIDISADMGGKGLSATLKLHDPDASAKPISRIELSSKYKQTDLKGVLK